MTQALMQPDKPTTVAEFLTWDLADGFMWQLVNGTPMAMAPPGWRRNALLGELQAVIRSEGDLVLDRTGSRTPLLHPCRHTRLHPGTAA